MPLKYSNWFTVAWTVSQAKLDQPITWTFHSKR